MALNPAGLQSSLAAFLGDVPPTETECAQEWADALQAYASTVTPPSSTVAAAATAFKGALTGMGVDGAAAAKFATAMTAFGASLAGGMVPPAVPPPAPFVLPVSLTDNPSVAATAISTAIQLWMVTGTSAPPASVPWA